MHLPDLGDIHDRYLALANLAHEVGARNLGGKLLLRTGFDAEGISVQIAASLAGAATLCVDAEPELLREGMRRGLCDFLVADLSEALRILKNEIRRQRAVSVCVAAEPDAFLREMADRGVQPDLVSAQPTSASAVAALGAIPVPAAQPDPETRRMEWSVEDDVARAMPRLTQIASAVLDEERADTPPRRTWLAHAPRRLGRSWSGRQCARMTPAEAKAFTQQASAVFPAISLQYDAAPH